MSTFIWPFPLSTIGDASYAEYGPRFNGTDHHHGMDFNGGDAGRTGATIPAAADGAVAFAGWRDDGHGNCVMLDHGPLPGDPRGWHAYTVYSHQYRTPDVSAGQHVTQAQRLGGIGTTGNSGGNHLHFETGIGPAGLTHPYQLTRLNPREAIPEWNQESWDTMATKQEVKDALVEVLYDTRAAFGNRNLYDALTQLLWDVGDVQKKASMLTPAQIADLAKQVAASVSAGATPEAIAEATIKRLAEQLQ